jgi:hypothetical protein
MTARTAGEVSARALGSGGKSGIDDGEEFVHRNAISLSSTQA